MNKTLKRYGKASYWSAGFAIRKCRMLIAKISKRRFDLNLVINGDKPVATASIFGIDILTDEFKNRVCADLEIPRRILFGDKV